MEALSETETLKAQLPKAFPSSASTPAAAAANVARHEPADDIDRNPIFDALVTPDEDISGLVAYSIYKQNKRAWLDDFIKATGRAPTDAEVRAYIIGESTERRLNTYRHLAAATLAGQGPRAANASGIAGKVNSIPSAVWAVAIVIAAIAVLALAMHGGLLGAASK